MKAITDCAKKLIEAPRYNVGDFVGVYGYETDVRIYDIRWEGSCFVYKVYLADEETWLYDNDIAYKKDGMIEGLVETPKFKKGDCVKCSDGSCGIIVTCDWSDSLNCYQYYIDYIGTLDAGYQPEKDLQPHTITTMNGRDIFEGAKWKHEFECPEGYIFKDENGNIINATKIVLEKKKKEYPKTYEECCRVVNANSCIRLVYNLSDGQKYYHDEDNLYLYENFRRLKICRDAYWTIYGEESGLGKPWEPTMETVYCISRNNNVMKCSYRGGKSNILEFPTPEMRDTFYENFKELINECKELL